MSRAGAIQGRRGRNYPLALPEFLNESTGIGVWPAGAPGAAVDRIALRRGRTRQSINRETHGRIVMAASTQSKKRRRGASTRRTDRKVDFVRHHPELSDSDTVAAAAKRGLRISRSQVERVRAESPEQTRRHTAARGRRQRGAPKNGRQERPPLSKSEFIRTRPPGMTAKQVVAAARALGMSMSEHFVYNIRSTAKKRAAGSAARLSGSASRATAGQIASREAEFRRLTLALGLDRAKELLAEVEAKLTNLISGR